MIESTNPIVKTITLNLRGCVVVNWASIFAETDMVFDRLTRHDLLADTAHEPGKLGQLGR